MSRFRPPLTGTGLLPPPRSRSTAAPTPVAAAQVPSAMPVASAPVRPKAVTTSPVGGFLVGLMGLYIMVHVIPAAELLDVFVGTSFRIAALTGALITLGALFSGHLARFWQLPVAKAWLGLLGVYFLASLAGTYPRGSLDYMVQYAARFHTFPFLICAVAHNAGSVRRLMYWGALAGVFGIVLTAATGQSVEGRLEIPETSLGNPNDLALTLLLGGLFILTMAYAERAVVRLVPLVALPAALYFILQTGSRANFVTIVVLGVVVFWSAPTRVRLKALALIPVVAIAMLALVPKSTLDRLTAITSNPLTDLMRGTEHGDAVASQLARTRLQRRALELAAKHPVLGVGPQQFEVAVEEMVQDETGSKSTWQNAHNVYLQVTAEIGFPGGLLFIGIMLWMLRLNFKVYRAVVKSSFRREYEGQTFCLFLLGVAYSVGISFGNYMYDPNLPILVGLTAANALCFSRDVQLAKAASASPALRA